jgi:hypothetical protein
MTVDLNKFTHSVVSRLGGIYIYSSARSQKTVDLGVVCWLQDKCTVILPVTMNVRLGTFDQQNHTMSFVAGCIPKIYGDGLFDSLMYCCPLDYIEYRGSNSSALP